MLVSNQILISNRNETYSKSAFGSQTVILLKILSLDFFFNKKPRTPQLLYVNCSEWVVFLHKRSHLQLVMFKLMQHLPSLSQVASVLIFCQDF